MFEQPQILTHSANPYKPTDVGMTLANGTWVSEQVLLSRASIITGPRGHTSPCHSAQDLYMYKSIYLLKPS